MQQSITDENIKDFSVSKDKKDVDAALSIIEKNYDQWTTSLNDKVASVLNKYESAMPDKRLEYEQKLRHAKLLNGTLVDIISGDLTY